MKEAMLLVGLLTCAASTLGAQRERLSAGVLLGATSDYAAPVSGQLVAATAGRQLSLGVPIRLRLTEPRSWTLALLGSVEWSYAEGGAPTDGLAQFALGPELQRSIGSHADLRLGALAGLMTRRDDQFDRADHAQYGFEAGSGVQLRSWRLGYTYRRAWVTDVQYAIRGCAGAVRTPCAEFVAYGPERTLSYDRHALSLERRFKLRKIRHCRLARGDDSLRSPVALVFFIVSAS